MTFKEGKNSFATDIRTPKSKQTVSIVLRGGIGASLMESHGKSQGRRTYK